MPVKFIYTGTHVTNLRKPIAFYTKALGIRLLFTTRIKETGGRVAWLRSKGSKQILELNAYPRRYKYGGKSGLDHLAFELKDAVAEYRKLSKKHRVAIAPFREGKWMLAYAKDPNGNWIELGSRLKKRRRRSS